MHVYIGIIPCISLEWFGIQDVFQNLETRAVYNVSSNQNSLYYPMNILIYVSNYNNVCWQMKIWSRSDFRRRFLLVKIGPENT